jgi:hypothetical protein
MRDSSGASASVTPLMAAFRFTEGDLLRNRAGRLSRRQRLRRVPDVLAFALATTFFSFVFVHAAFLRTDLAGHPSSPAPFGLASVASGVLGALFAWAAVVALRGILAGRVVAAEGRIALHREQGRGYAHSRLVIDGKHLTCRRIARGVLDPRAVYRVYYAPTDGWVVSVEVV